MTENKTQICRYCHKELPVETNFCWYCTRQLEARPERPDAEPKGKPLNVRYVLIGAALVILAVLYWLLIAPAL